MFMIARTDCFAARAAYINLDTKYSPCYPAFNVYNIRLATTLTFLPDNYIKYLQDPSIQRAIGANVDMVFANCSNDVKALFATNEDCKYFTISSN